MISQNYKKAALIALIGALTTSNVQAGWFDWMPSWLGGQAEWSSRQSLVAAVLGAASIATGYVFWQRYRAKKHQEAEFLDAAKNGQWDLVETFLKKGVDPNASDSQHRTALYHAFKDSTPDGWDKVKLLRNHGAKYGYSTRPIYGRPFKPSGIQSSRHRKFYPGFKDENDPRMEMIGEVCPDSTRAMRHFWGEPTGNNRGF